MWADYTDVLHLKVEAQSRKPNERSMDQRSISHDDLLFAYGYMLTALRSVHRIGSLTELINSH